MRLDYLPNDFEARLNGGVAFYGTQPVIISTLGERITISNFPSGEPIKEISKDDENLDISSPQLGYVNMNRNCYFVYRRPARRYKQTLTHQSIDYFDPSADRREFTPGPDIRELFYSKNFASMLTDKYPPLDGVFAAFNSKTSKIKSRAISRDVALAIDSFGIIRVFYKMEEVGHINPGSTVVQVPSGTLAWVISEYLKDFSWEII
jgi:hypothetical protein